MNGTRKWAGDWSCHLFLGPSFGASTSTALRKSDDWNQGIPNLWGLGLMIFRTWTSLKKHGFHVEFRGCATNIYRPGYFLVLTRTQTCDLDTCFIHSADLRKKIIHVAVFICILYIYICVLLYIYIIWLVVWNIFHFFHILGIIVPTDFHINIF